VPGRLQRVLIEGESFSQADAPAEMPVREPMIATELDPSNDLTSSPPQAARIPTEPDLSLVSSAGSSHSRLTSAGDYEEASLLGYPPIGLVDKRNIERLTFFNPVSRRKVSVGRTSQGLPATAAPVTIP